MRALLIVLALAASSGCGDGGGSLPIVGRDDTQPIIDTEGPDLVVNGVSTAGRISGDSVGHACSVTIDLLIQSAGHQFGYIDLYAKAFTSNEWQSTSTPWPGEGPTTVSAPADPALPGDSLSYTLRWSPFGSPVEGVYEGTTICDSDFAWTTDTATVTLTEKVNIVPLLPGVAESYYQHEFERPPNTSAPQLLNCESQPDFGSGASSWDSIIVVNDTVTWGEWPLVGLYFSTEDNTWHNYAGGCWVYVFNWRRDPEYFQHGSPMFVASSSAPVMNMRVVRSYWGVPP